MPESVRTDIDGAAELDRSLHRAADQLAHLDAAGQQSGQAVRLRAQALAPVDTGALSRSIYAEWTGTEVRVGSPLEYAPYQEYGTVDVPASPYLRPALEASTAVIVDAYTGEIQKLLDRVEGA